MIDDDSPGRPAGYRPGRDAAPGDRANAAAKDERREPVFTAFDADEDEDYEESERDTDFASTYEDDDEEYLESTEDDDPEALDLDWQVLGGSTGLGGSTHDARRNPWADSDPAGAKSDDGGADTTDHGPALTEPLEQDEDDEFADNEISYDAEEDWEDEEDYADDPDDFERELYYWNYDLLKTSTRATGLSFIELGEKITSLPADVILATDACHSGMAGSDLVRGLDPNELAKRIYAINERGLYILNASRSEEFAREHEKIGHGVFTKAILETLEFESDLTMMNLMASIQKRVLYYTNHLQTPVFRMYGDLLPLTIFEK